MRWVTSSLILQKQFGMATHPLKTASQKLPQMQQKPVRKEQNEFKLLIQIMDSIPVSASECERSFSAMNEVVFKKRNAILEQ
jgi:hypothetical protein